ncbi:MAG: hypothetical protein ACXAC7_01775 [Candidatus Hodarchaeales archaeon]|jgi:hypothetical protein
MSYSDDVISQAEIFAIGIGECGSNLVASYLHRSQEKKLSARIREFLIMNTDRSDLTKTRERYNLSKARTLIYGNVEIGVGGRFIDGYNTVLESKDVILNTLSQLGFEGISGFVIFTSLGGGTGCGGTPALIKLLRERFEKEEGRKIFIYVVGVLPFEGQSSESLNTAWGLSHLLRAQLEEVGPDLILLLSNRTMLSRVLSWQSGEVSELVQTRLGDDILDFSSVAVEKRAQDREAYMKEDDFIELINPLAMEAIDYMLSPGITERGKTVHPTTDLADYSRKLDSIVVPCLFDDIPIFPEAGDMDSQFLTAIEYSIAKTSLTNMGRKPDAESVYAVFSGSKELSRIEYGPLMKRALKPFIAKGASVTPTFISYEKDDFVPSLLLLFGYPKVPEIREILDEAKGLIQLHSKGSELKEHWFKRSKGVTKDVLVQAVDDLEQLFGIYMTEAKAT